VINLSFDPHAAGDNTARGTAFATAFLEKVQALPGVTAASLAVSLPMGEVSYGGMVVIPGRPPAPNHGDAAGYNAVTPDYFTTMGIRLIGGRSWRTGENGAAVINQAMQRKFWPSGDALGQTFTLNSQGKPAAYRVVGVAANSVNAFLADSISPFAYLPFEQNYTSPVTLQARLSGPNSAVALREAREQARAVDAQVPVFDAQTMLTAMHGINGYFLFELGAMLAAAMGLAGLFMAIIGVYGVVAYGASQRTHEFGVRMALGAERGQILRLVLRQGVVMTAAGLAIGLLLAALFGHATAGLLYGVGGLDPWAFGGATLLLASVAVLASLVPARRAVAGDPVRALRWE
jgi:putative ABC transport system permease protein